MVVEGSSFFSNCDGAAAAADDDEADAEADAMVVVDVGSTLLGGAEVFCSRVLGGGLRLRLRLRLVVARLGLALRSFSLLHCCRAFR